MARHTVNILAAAASIWLCLLALPLPAQTGGGTQDGGAADRSLLADTGPLDTVTVYWRHWESRDILQKYNDTLPHEGLYFYEPGQARMTPFAHLGNTGSPVRSLWWEPAADTETGLRLGAGAYAALRWNLGTLRYPTASKPYTRVTVVQGTAPINTTAERQQNGTFDLLFTRPFTERLHVFLDYRWLDFAGQYERQRAKLGRLATGLDFISRDHRYTARLLVAMNAGVWQHNGGIAADSLLTDTDPYRVRNNIPVQFNAAASQLRERQFILQQEFSPGGFLPSLRLVSRYYTGYRKHTDLEPDSSFYPEAYLFDDRGLRRYGDLRYFDNELWLKFSRKGPFRLDVAAAHRIGWHRDEVTRPAISLQQIGIRGRASYRRKAWQFEAAADINRYNGSINYAAHARGSAQLGEWLAITAKAWTRREHTALMDTDFVFNDRRIATANPAHTGATGADFSLHSEKIGLGITGRIATIQGLVYFDSKALAFNRLDPLAGIGQLALNYRLKAGPFRFESRAGIQSMGGHQHIFGLPEHFASGTLRAEGYIFRRAMWATAGIYAQYTPAFQSLGFSPILGEWIVPNDLANINAYTLANFFIQFRVDKLQGFLLLENLSSFLSDTHWYTSPNRPMQDFSYKVGIMWHFRN